MITKNFKNKIKNTNIYNILKKILLFLPKNKFLKTLIIAIMIILIILGILSIFALITAAILFFIFVDEGLESMKNIG